MKLPKKYTDWLKSVNRDNEIIFDNCVYRIYSEKELDIKGPCASNFFKSTVFVDGVDVVHAESAGIDNSDEKFPLDSEASKSFITLGDSNGNYLFTDPNDNYSCWLVVKLNKAVFKISKDLECIVQNAKHYEGTP